MKHLLIPITLVILCASLFTLASSAVMAQSGQASNEQSIKQSNSPQDTTCPAAQTFTFGNGQNLFKFCISTHGNVQRLFSPGNYRQVDTTEGYVACGTGAANAFDAGFTESGWGAATAIQPGGANTFPLTIKRQTTDGKFELKQTFEWNTLEKEILITMVLKNISAGSITNVKLARYFDGDLNSTDAVIDDSDDIYDANSDSVWGRDSGTGAGHHELMLTALAFAVSHTTAAETFSDFNPAGAVQTGRTCTPIPRSVPTVPSDSVGRVTYNIGTMAAAASKTVKVLYRRL